MCLFINLLELRDINLKAFKILPFIFGLALVVGIGYGAWLLLREFYSAIAAASPEVTAAVIGAMATVMVGLSAVLISQSHERRRAAEEAHRLKKIEIYQGFINMVSQLIGASNENLSLKEPSPEDLVQFAFKFKSDLLLWGSPKVIKAQISFEAASGSGNSKKYLMRSTHYISPYVRILV